MVTSAASNWTDGPQHPANRARVRALLLLLPILAVPAAVSAQGGSWSVQHSGHATALYLHQNTSRGAERFTATTWWMPAISRASESSTLTFHAMLTIDPVIQGECGYPRLLTNFAFCNDAPFEDRSMQHPLIMGLGGRVDRKLGEQTRLGLELAAAGEPAFGPTSYFMRASASNDPIMPLTHHSLNPAHTAYGVITPALSWRGLRAEASVYNGSSMDADPYDFDFAPLHSYAGRVSYALSPALTAQLSATSMQGGENSGGGHGEHGAGGRLNAYSGSLALSRATSDLRTDAVLAWAAHRVAGTTTHAGLLEAQLGLGAHHWFARAELADRIEFENFFIDHPDGTHEHIATPRRQRITELTAGYALRLPGRWGVQPQLGARGSMLRIPTLLQQRYNTDRGTSIAIFTSLRLANGASHHH